MTAYKQTELGLIPSDWEVVELEKITLTDGLVRGPFGGALKKEFFVSNGFKVYEQRNAIYGNAYIGNYFIDADKFRELNRFAVQANDFIVSCSGTIGKIYQIPEFFPKGIINQALLKITLNSRINHKFFYHVFVSDDFQNKIIDSTQGGAMKNLIGMAEFRKSLFPLPNKPEQTAIATALSDTDALLTELEKLLAKKQAIKTATMQQLLTGKTRLPEFAYRADGTPKGSLKTEWGDIPEDWEVVALGDIGETIIGLTYSPSNVKSFGTLVLRSSNIQNNKLEFQDNVFVDMELPERVITKENDILICVRNGSRQLIGKCALIDKKTSGSAFGAFMSIFRTPYATFVFYAFQSSVIQNQIKEVMGATINQITNKNLSEFKISIPKSITEQTAIAQILGDMDSEITALQARIEKVREIKQGMMQNLLTGKIRLPF